MEVFGRMPHGSEVYSIILQNGGMECEVITYGAAIRRLVVPDRDGGRRDVVLGCDTLEEYLRHTEHFSAVIGRYANRIADSQFTLNGVVYHLTPNEGRNQLHGGPNGFDRRNWTVDEAAEDRVTLRLFSPHEDAGYPGNLDVTVTYTLTEDALSIAYEAICDRDTVCNLTNHMYFNLNGHAAGSVLGQAIQILSDAYTPAGPGNIPTGEIAAVGGTPLDLRIMTPIGAHIDDDFAPLRNANGYDHNYVLRNQGDITLQLAAVAVSEDGGLRMETWTTEPGVQFYTGNFIPEGLRGKDGAVYHRLQGFCLETQHYPDAPNHPDFPSTVLRKGETFRSRTEYRFAR